MPDRSSPPDPADIVTVANTAEAGGPAPLYVARAVRGPSDGKALVLDWNRTPQVLVGQSPVCELALADPRVSRRHLSLSPDGASVRLVDLRSTNGTKIGGARVIEALLSGGEVIEIGDSAIRILRAGELQAPAASRDRFGRVLGKSQAMQRLFVQCEALAAAALPIILEGESGTGKELVSEAIHEAGPRARGPFVVFDCAGGRGDAEQLAALFGTEAGPGAIEQANGGTLVLDQVGELGPHTQSRLVAALDRGEIRRSPAAPPVRLFVRVIATTRDDLDRLVQERIFREELLFRLAGARVEIPPLRQRHGDVDLLARHFWRLLDGRGELPRHLALELLRHDFRGNVRELEHVIARGAVFGDEAAVAREDADSRDYLERILAMGLPLPRARQLVVREFERRFVERAVREHGGNVSRAAAVSGLTRRYFHMLLAKNKE